MVDNRSWLPPRRARQGAPGAGWLIIGVYVFSVFVFTAWMEGWGENHAQRTAAPPTSHRGNTTGLGSQ